MEVPKRADKKRKNTYFKINGSRKLCRSKEKNEHPDL